MPSSLHGRGHRERVRDRRADRAAAGIARQAVQRVADLLVGDGLAAYEPNPSHRRAKLLRPTAEGQAALHTISMAQKEWADAVGAEAGPAKLARAIEFVREIRTAVAAHDSPSGRSG